MIIPDKIRESASLETFRQKIKLWKPGSCLCRICKKYIANVGFINLSWIPSNRLIVKVLCIYIYIYIYIYIIILELSLVLLYQKQCSMPVRKWTEQCKAKRESMKDYKYFFYQYLEFHVFTRQSSAENLPITI